MAETQPQSGGTGSDFDLTQFYQILSEEAGENLDLMEQMLLNLNLQTADDEVETPRMDGIDVLGRLMRLRPMPVVMNSTLTDRGADVTMKAL